MIAAEEKGGGGLETSSALTDQERRERQHLLCSRSNTPFFRKVRYSITGQRAGDGGVYHGRRGREQNKGLLRLPTISVLKSMLNSRRPAYLTPVVRIFLIIHLPLHDLLPGPRFFGRRAMANLESGGLFMAG